MFLQKSITYLKSNNIKYFKLFNILISLPITSPQFDFLYFKNTKKINFTNPFTSQYILILITKY